MRWLAVLVGLLGALIALPGTAHAKAEPTIGYVFGSYGLPYHAAFRTSKVNNQWKTTNEIGYRHSGVGLDAVGFGAGIGYSGLNFQLDVASALRVTSGLLTVGFRTNLQFGGFEVWGRLGAGPLIAFDRTTNDVALAGGLAAMIEGGVDYFLLPDRVALGVKGVAVPQYAFPTTFAGDFNIAAGLRIVL